MFKVKVRFLFTVALLLAVAGVAAVSCQKKSGEDTPEVGGKSGPVIKPYVMPVGDLFRIATDGTSILGTSRGYSYQVTAKSITLQTFNCDLTPNLEFELINECSLTLVGDSVIQMVSGHFATNPITLSGNGSLTFRKLGRLNMYEYKQLITVAEGYNMTYSGEVDEGNNTYSYTWKVKKVL